MNETVLKIPTMQEHNLAPNAQILLCKRYYTKLGNHEPCVHCGERHETHEEFLTRIAGPKGTVMREQIEMGKFLPNSPTLFNRGLNNGTLSACFVFEIEDTMESIMNVARDSVFTAKFGGGVGYYLGNLRPKGATVNSTHGKAMGPVEVMRYLHAGGRLVTQSGKRAAAQMAVMPVEHPDIEEFITCKDENPDDISTFNISVSVPDEFMRRALAGDDSALRILNRIAESAWRTGDPGLFFRDRINEDNPTPQDGPILACNPCSEQGLKNNESCQLASANLLAFYSPDYKSFDFAGLKYTVANMVRYLNDILDENIYPTPGIAEAALYTRRIGIGFMGLGDLLAVMGLEYDSLEARNWAEVITKTIRDQCEKTTKLLAQRHGPAPCYEGTTTMRRNAIMNSIQPTGTTALLLGISTGLEPLFALENTRVTNDGDTLIERPISVQWLKENQKPMPKTADQIAPEHHVRMVAAVQEYIDNGISKTINMPNSATVEDIRDCMLLAWSLGCKTISIFRDGCREKQVLTKCGDEICDISLAHEWVYEIANEKPTGYLEPTRENGLLV